LLAQQTDSYSFKLIQRNHSRLFYFLILFSQFFGKNLSAQPYFDLANAQYITIPRKDVVGSNTNPSSVNYMSAVIALPIKIKDDLLIFSPFFERYDLTLNKETGNNQVLTSIGMPVTYLKQWKKPEWKTAFVFIPRINSDFTTLDRDYQLGGAILAIYKKKENLKYKFGLYYNSEYFGPFFMPLLGLDWKINDRFILYGVLPGSLALEYKFSKVFYGGINFKSITNSYKFGRLPYMKISDNHPKLFLDTYLSKNFVISVEAGHTILRKYKTANTSDQFNQNIFNDGFLLKASLSWRIRLDETLK
jgi:hypothetical protein